MRPEVGRSRDDRARGPRRLDGGASEGARRGPPDLGPPEPYEPDVWVRDDPPRERPPKKRRDRSAPVDAELVARELTSALGPAKGARAAGRVVDAARAFGDGRLDDARRVLGPVAKDAPRSPAVRELLGLTLYQQGRWRPAAKELEAFRELTGSVDQHPVLADCYRAMGRHRDAETLWAELGEASPDAALVAEGRIVAAGSLADRGRIDDAIRVLESAPRGKKAREHHLRTAYALADLRERAGDVSRARELFAWIVSVDPDFADAHDRLDNVS